MVGLRKLLGDPLSGPFPKKCSGSRFDVVNSLSMDYFDSKST